MATTKPEATPETPKTTAVVTWKDRMAAVAAQAAQTEAPKGGFLSFKGGNISYDDNPIPGNKLEVIVTDFLLENSMFREKYNPNKPASPMCYAFGRDEADMKPHPECEEPQHPQCGIPGEEGCCPNNEWGSDPDGGRGKACKNSRRIALITTDCLGHEDSATRVKKANTVMCKIPLTSIKNFSSYVNQCAKVLDVHPFAVVTELSTKPHPTSLFQVHWKVMDTVKAGDDVMQALYEKHVATGKLLNQPYPKQEEEAAPAPKGKSTKY